MGPDGASQRPGMRKSHAGATPLLSSRHVTRPPPRGRSIVTMHFARLLLTGDRADPRLRRLTADAAVDLLQLDFPRRLWVAADERPPAPPADFATGFAEQLKPLGTALYLNPQFRVISSAGWGHAYGCVEAAARQLVEQRNGEIPLAAIRGCNLLPILEDLLAAGSNLDHAETGTPFSELHQPIVAADLQIGAGPIAAALAEGARLVIAGAYDATAPAIATSVTRFNWSWDDAARLAGAAAGALAVSGPPPEKLPPGSVAADLWMLYTGRIAEGGDAVISSVAEPGVDAAQLQQWLSHLDAAGLERADVSIDRTSIRANQLSLHDVGLSCVAGQRETPTWRLNMTYFSHYEMNLVVGPAAGGNSPAAARYLELLQRHFADLGAADGTTTVQSLGPAEHRLLHIRGKSSQWPACREMADEAAAWMLRVGGDELTAYGPSVRANYAVWPTHLPPGAVDIAVDTRTAQDWI